MSTPHHAALAGLLLGLAVGVVSAQATGSLAVQVLDVDGDPLEGATVTISHATGNVRTTAVTTDRRGWVRFPVLRAGGGYSIDVESAGFGRRRETDLRVPIGREVRIPVQLAEEVREAVKVIVESDVVKLEETHASTKLTDDFIGDLPVPGRFYQNVLTLAPGVNDPDGDGNPTVHGSRSRDFKAEVSGVSNVDPLTGQFLSYIHPASIEEIEVIPAGASVEFGRAQGGFARVVQKQGTNDFEAVIEFYYRSSDLDGDGAGDFSNLPDESFESIQPSVQVSGPIVKDKVWFRLSHELFDGEPPINVVNGLVIENIRRQLNSDQITWQVSPRNKLAFLYQSDPLEISNVGVDSQTGPDSSQRIDNSGETFSIPWTAAFSPRILVESIAAYQDVDIGLLPQTTGVPNSCVVGRTFLRRAYCTNHDTQMNSGSYFRTWEDNRSRLTVQTKATLFGGRLFGADHQVKLGFTAENERYFRSLRRSPDIDLFKFVPDATFAKPDPEPIFTVVARVAVPETDDVRATGTNWSLFAEDQIKPMSNLVISAGVRVDREEITANGASFPLGPDGLPRTPASELEAYRRLFDACVAAHARTGPAVCPGQFLTLIPGRVFTGYEGLNEFALGLAETLGESPQRIVNSFAAVAAQSQFWDATRRPDNLLLNNTNVAPRLAVNWDPWGNGKTAIGVSAGRYYDKLFLGIPLTELEPAFTSLTYNAELNALDQVAIRLLSESVNPTVSIQIVDRNLKTPYQDEFRVFFKREIFPETSIRVEYVKRKYRDQLQDTDLNRLPGDFGTCRLGDSANTRPLEPSPGEGQLVFDPHTNEQYVDTDPGIGDGRIDDCVGVIVELDGQTPDPFNRSPSSIRLPDGFPDLYVQNPAWGNILQIGNHNQADYEGVIVELVRRQYRSWEMQASYTWSMVRGDGDDFEQQLGNDSTLVDDEFGFQSNDQRHVVRLNATTITPWGFRLGALIRWESGLPYSIQASKLSFDSVPQFYENLGTGIPAQTRVRYPTGTRNDQRNLSMWTVDAKLSKEIKVGRGVNLQLSAEVFNLLNDGTLMIYNPRLESGVQLNGTNEAVRRFGRSWQLGTKIAF